MTTIAFSIPTWFLWIVLFFMFLGIILQGIQIHLRIKMLRQEQKLRKAEFSNWAAQNNV